MRGFEVGLIHKKQQNTENHTINSVLILVVTRFVGVAALT